MLWGIYSAIYGEVNVSVSGGVEIKGDYVEKEQSCFISVTLKSWSGRKLLDPTACIFKSIFLGGHLNGSAATCLVTDRLTQRRNSMTWHDLKCHCWCIWEGKHFVYSQPPAQHTLTARSCRRFTSLHTFLNKYFTSPTDRSVNKTLLPGSGI